jgi:hypothetical protein
MAKLTLAVAALVAVSLAGTRVQAQAEQEMATFDQPTVVQDVQAPIAEDVQAPVVELAQAPVVEDVQAPVAEDVQAPVSADLAASTGPSIDAATLSPRLSNHTASKANAMRRPSRGSGVGLMIFGGAALITGLIIGDDAGTVIAVGGALVGLYGLYVYLGRPTGMEHSSRIGLGYKLNTN